MGKIMFISDIHGSYEAIKKAFEAFNREKAVSMHILGDVFYHGPRNPFPGEYAPQLVSELLNGNKDKIEVIKGNCDSEVDEMISNFPFLPSRFITINGLRVFETHGHKFNEDNLPDEKPDLIVYGHLHTGFIREKNGVVAANPGSISLPKEGTPPGYLILSGRKLVLKTLSGAVIAEKEL